MRFSEQMVFFRSEAFPLSTLLPLNLVFGIVVFFAALLFPKNLQAQVPQKVITECNACGPTSVYAAEVDGDGNTDLLSASRDDNKIAWYENDGNADPSFTAHTITTNADNAKSVYAADVDGDGDTDVLSASSNDNKIAWYENDGSADPGFTAHMISTGADGAISVHAADVDGDGDTDVLSAASDDDMILWYENDGSADPSFTTRRITTNARGAQSVYTADVDEDGNTDVLSASEFDDKIARHKNDGADDPDFTALTITTGTTGASSVYAGDLDGDTDTDVLSASSSDDKIAWHEHDGTSSDGGWTAHTITTNADRVESVYAVDIDGDDALDILSASSLDNKIAWYENDGTSEPSFTTHTITTEANGATSVYAANVDGESGPDILSASVGDDKIVWYENDGDADPNFTAHTITTNADGAVSVHTADVDGDGDTDVLSASEFDNKIAWYENDGADSPSFTTHVITTNADFASSVHAADIDGDSDTDVLSASSGDGKIAWHENDGSSDPDFTERAITLNAGTASSIYPADVNGDNNIDILSAWNSDDKISWFESDGFADPSFTAHTITTEADGATSVYAANVDGESGPDILSASESDDKIAWYENGSSAPLPVELARLTARNSGRDVQLTWQTASETNNAGFYVQRQGPSQEEWARLGFVEGGGTTSEPQSYRFEAEALGPGTHEFRLRQVDTDGTAHLSEVVSTDIQMREKAQLSAPAPNPAATTARLTFAVKESKKVTVTLYNTLGQQVATLYEGRPASGEQVSLQLDTSTLSSGAYIVRLKAGGAVKTRKITVVK